VSVRTSDRVRVGFCVRDKRSRRVVTGERGLTLDEVESEILNREKRELRGTRKDGGLMRAAVDKGKGYSDGQ
jgi:hypothetical protein